MTPDQLRNLISALPVPPGDSTAAMTRASYPARPSVRRLAPVLASVAVLLLMLGIVLQPRLVGLPDRHPASPSPAGAALPDRLAGYSYLTASVSQSPPGRAIALYQHGLGLEIGDWPQVLVIAADSDTYRRVDMAENRVDAEGSMPRMLLSPDGVTVAAGTNRALGDIALQDLTTGSIRTIPVESGAETIPLAWSPDGSRMAVAVSGSTGAMRLMLLDLRTGAATRVSGADDTYIAGWSPDGTELAVQIGSGGGVTIIDAGGQVRRTLNCGCELWSDAASWSPDGKLLAVAQSGSDEPDYGFADATGTGQPVPGTLPGKQWVLGWTGPRTVITNPARGEYVEVNIDTHAQRPLFTADEGPNHNFTIGSMYFARDLVLGGSTREAGSPGRGPWPAWLRVTAIVLIAALILTIGAVVRRRRRAGDQR